MTKTPAVTIMVADFEKAIWSGFRQAMPTVAIRSCNFHMGQAVWNKARSLGLQV
ncbi:hypothetical protein DPMN_049756 [Dreissena polymorpha]|uniref:MULE transposase domain-containing protein n=1 Tax=Dreissena polymorpha TaxID=45954 RepID=A0A9D4HNL6_DREPO|nr:hypothetical protein DPMN_049756 [Dreissena polymorpha]